MTPCIQRTGIITGIDTPEHYKHHHVILPGTISSQHPSTRAE